MYKRILALSFVFMLAFSPVAAIAAEVDEANDANESAEVESTNSDEASDEAEDEAEESTEAESEDGEADEVEESDESEEVVEEDNVEADEDADTETNATEEETDEDVDIEEDEEEISPFATEDEDLNLGEIYGTANGDIEYDIASGNYVLGLQAGLSNYTNTQDIENKWVGFAIPNGVDVVGELPSGVVPIFISGKSGLAVKVPNIRGIGG